MTQPVIVGTDGSEPARHAVATAAQLATALGAELRVVCAYEKLEVATLNEGSDAYRYASDEEALEIAQREATLVSDHLTAVPMAIQGKPAEALLHVAEDTEASLIVVGNKRVQGMARLLGSIASSVAAKAPCDVYIAHTH